MGNVYAESFEKKWYITTPLLALITTQGRCLNYICKKQTTWENMVCNLRRVLWGYDFSFAGVHDVVCVMSTPAGKHRSLAPLLICKLYGGFVFFVGFPRPHVWVFPARCPFERHSVTPCPFIGLVGLLWHWFRPLSKPAATITVTCFQTPNQPAVSQSSSQGTPFR